MADPTSMPEMLTFSDVLANELQDPEFRAEWERLAPARAVAIRLIQFRADNNLTQTALARRLGMSQPAVARLEIGEHVLTLATLIRMADALDIEFLLGVRPKDRQPAWISPNADDDGGVERVPTARGGEVLFAVS